MPDSCCAVGCTNRRGDRPGVCFYRIPSEKDSPARRMLWVHAIRGAAIGRNGTAGEWRPSKYTRLCSEHFITRAKSDDPLNPDWVPSVFSDAPATKKRKKRKKEHGTETYRQRGNVPKRLEEEQKKRDAVNVLLNLSSAPEAESTPPEAESAPPEAESTPPAEEEEPARCCGGESCEAAIERLQRECNGLRRENRRLKDFIQSVRFDELVFKEEYEERL